MPDLVKAQELVAEKLGTAGIALVIIVVVIGVIFIGAVCWVNFEQTRQLGKLYKQMKLEIGNEADYGDTKLILSDFNGVVIKKVYMIVLTGLFIITTAMNLYMGDRLVAMIHLFLLYFPIWKLTKSDGLTVSQISMWETINKVLLVWICIKAAVVFLVAILSVVGISLIFPIK